jgi:hypothetical protein
MSRVAAPSRRPSSSRARARLWHRRGARPIQPGSSLYTAHHAWQNDTCSTGLATLSCGDTHAQLGREGPEAWVRDVFSRGMAGVQEWPPGLDRRRPFFDEYLRQGGVFTTFHSSTPDAERFAQLCSSQCSRLLASAHVSGQNLLTFQGIYQLFKLAVAERQPYRTVGDFLRAAERWVNFYNTTRPHESLDYRSPDQFAKAQQLDSVPKITLF